MRWVWLSAQGRKKRVSMWLFPQLLEKSLSIFFRKARHAMV
jgi:hypothetical protein